MNATQTPNVHANPTTTRPEAAIIPPPRRELRSRGLGAGYGNSSGYFSRQRYSHNALAPRFRCS